MSTRHMFYLLVIAMLSASNIGCCGIMGGCGAGFGGQLHGAGFASCGCPEASCGCEDNCCEASCGCDDYCEASCGCDDVCSDVGCGSGVTGPCRLFGRCLIIQRLRKAFSGTCIGYGGYSSGGSWSEWNNDPPCNCNSASTGGHYGGAYGRRAFLAKQHQNLSEELRFADEGSGTTYR